MPENTALEKFYVEMSGRKDQTYNDLEKVEMCARVWGKGGRDFLVTHLVNGQEVAFGGPGEKPGEIVWELV